MIQLRKLYYLGNAKTRSGAAAGTTTRVDFADRWLKDGLAVADIPGGSVEMDIDMSGISQNNTPLIVQAAALALKRLPHLHVMAIGNRRYYPEHIEIGLSVAGETFIAPVMKILEPEKKTVSEITREISARQAEIRNADARMLALIRRWGWIVPFSWLRRMILRGLLLSFNFRRQGVGTFQITQLPDVDRLSPNRMTASVLLAIGAVRERIMAIDGKPEVRPTMTVTCNFNHAAWDGMCAARFMAEFKQILESKKAVKILESGDSQESRVLDSSLKQ